MLMKTQNSNKSHIVHNNDALEVYKALDILGLSSLQSFVEWMCYLPLRSGKESFVWFGKKKWMLGSQ